MATAAQRAKEKAKPANAHVVTTGFGVESTGRGSVDRSFTEPLVGAIHSFTLEFVTEHWQTAH
jgi:hypothetical protein